jgi:hypothetical protein
VKPWQKRAAISWPKSFTMKAAHTPLVSSSTSSRRSVSAVGSDVSE